MEPLLQLSLILLSVALGVVQGQCNQQRQDLLPDASVYGGTYVCGQGRTGLIVRITEWPIIAQEWFGIDATCNGIVNWNVTVDPTGQEMFWSFVNHSYNPCNYNSKSGVFYLPFDGLEISTPSTAVCPGSPFFGSRAPNSILPNTSAVGWLTTSANPSSVQRVAMDPEKCWAVCNADPECRAYEFSPATAGCRLYSSVASLTSPSPTTFGYPSFKTNGACFCWGDPLLLGAFTSATTFPAHESHPLTFVIDQCRYCPSEAPARPVACQFDGRIVVPATMSVGPSNVTVLSCPTPYLSLGIHFVGIGFPQGPWVAITDLTITEGVALPSGASVAGWVQGHPFTPPPVSSPGPGETDLQLSYSFVVDSKAKSLDVPSGDLTAPSSLLVLSGGPFEVQAPVVVFTGAASDTLPAFIPANLPAGVVALALTYTFSSGSSSSSLVLPWSPRLQEWCYGHCGPAGLCPAPASATPTDDLDAFCQQASGSGYPYGAQYLAGLSTVTCLTAPEPLACLSYLTWLKQVASLVQPQLAQPLINVPADSFLAASMYSLPAARKRDIQALWLLYGPVMPGLAEVANELLMERSNRLNDIDRGLYTPEPSTRLGAYAATAGYQDGTVGAAVHRAIGVIYSMLGPIGEEQIGLVFNSAEARALFGDPVTGSSNLAMAQMEYNYWVSVGGTLGGQLGARFTPDVRAWLQEHIFNGGIGAFVGWLRGVPGIPGTGLGWLLVTGGALGFSGQLIGDPHVRNFDGCAFDFQGVGDFVLAATVDGSFALHGRMRKQRLFPKATMLSALAIRAGDRPIVEVRATGRGRLSVLLNGQYLSLAPRQSFALPGLSMKWLGTTQLDITYDNGVTLSVSTNAGNTEGLFWRTFLTLPGALRGQTVGLLGTKNDWPYDDFLFNPLVSPVGLPPFALSPLTCSLINSNGSLLNHWGNSWLLLDRNQSLFAYPASAASQPPRPTCQPAQFADPDWLSPTSADVIAAATPTLVTAGRNVCALLPLALQNECLIDYILAGGVSQLSDYQAAAQALALQQLLQNLSVTLSGPDQRNATLAWHTPLQTAAGPVFSVELVESGGSATVLEPGSRGLAFSFSQALAPRRLMTVRVSVTKDTAGRPVAVAVSSSLTFLYGACEPYCPAGYCGGDLCGSTCCLGAVATSSDSPPTSPNPATHHAARLLV